MPSRESFTLGTNSYYGTTFHELVHSTGHESRLKRLDKFARFGSNAYAVEELVAEIGGCYMLGSVGLPVLDSLENHASYLDSWLKVLKQDHKAIFQAAAAAAAAADCILKPSGVLEEVEAEAALI
jgi:antirestriction protein ArdC